MCFLGIKDEKQYCTFGRTLLIWFSTFTLKELALTFSQQHYTFLVNSSKLF